MNLSHLRLLAEDEHAFHVHDTRKNERFPVPKKGLKPATLKQITQHFAAGGEVGPQDADETLAQDFGLNGQLGRYTPEDTARMVLLKAQRYAPPQERPAFASVLSAIDPSSQASAVPPERAPGAIPKPQPKTSKGNVNEFTRAVDAGDYDTANASAPGGDPSSPQALAAFGTAQAARARAQAQQAAAAAPAAAPPPGAPPGPPPDPGAPAAAAVPQGGMGGVSGYDSAIREAGTVEQGATQTKADLASRMADEQLKLQQAYQQKQQETAAYWDGLAKKNLADIDKTQQDLASGKVDPGRWWRNRPLGLKMASIASLIAGGFAQAFTGGQNPGLQMLQKRIDEDIDAQKADLGKKQTMLGHYLAQGHSIQQAEQLVRAHSLAAFAGQLDMVATKNAGPEAQAGAQAVKAELGKKVFQDTMQAHQQGADLAIKGLQIQAARQSMAQQKAMLDAVTAYTKGGAPSPLLPKEITERAVTLPGGGRAFAGTTKDAEEARKTFGITDQLRGKIARYRALLDKGAGRFGPTDLDKAEGVRASILADMGHLHDLNRLSDKDLELFQQQVPDIRRPQLGSGHKVKLDSLGEDIDAKVLSTLKNVLQVAPPQTQGAGLVRY